MINKILVKWCAWWARLNSLSLTLVCSPLISTNTEKSLSSGHLHTTYCGVLHVTRSISVTREALIIIFITGNNVIIYHIS